MNVTRRIFTEALDLGETTSMLYTVNHRIFQALSRGALQHR